MNRNVMTKMKIVIPSLFIVVVTIILLLGLNSFANVNAQGVNAVVLTLIIMAMEFLLLNLFTRINL